MGECVWVDVDGAIKSLIEAQMGKASAYTTLKLATVKATRIESSQDWKSWALPGCAIVGSIVPYVDAKRHGDGLPHYEKAYRYEVLFIVEGDQEIAFRYAKILIKRCELALRTVGIGVQSSPDNEHTDRNKPLLALAEVRLLRHPTPDTFYGLGSLEFTVHSAV